MKDKIDNMGEKLDSLQMENEVLEAELTNEQRKAMIRELKRKYGKSWRKALEGLRGNETIKSFAATRWKLT